MSKPPYGKPHRRLRPTKARDCLRAFFLLCGLRRDTACVLDGNARARFRARASALVLAVTAPRYRCPVCRLSRGATYAQHPRRRAEYSFLKALIQAFLTLVVKND